MTLKNRRTQTNKKKAHPRTLPSSISKWTFIR